MLRQHAALALLSSLATAQMTIAQPAATEPPLAPDRYARPYAMPAAQGSPIEQTPQNVPYFPGGTSDGALPLPQLDQSQDIPIVQPPDVPPRPPLYPAQNMVPATNPPANVLVKAPLSWRAKAMQLRGATQAKATSLNTSFDDAVMTILATLPQCGLRMVVLNSKAGELLAAPADGQPRPLYVFTFSETSPGQVQVRGATTYTGKSAEPQSKVQRVLDSLPANLKGQPR